MLPAELAEEQLGLEPRRKAVAVYGAVSQLQPSRIWEGVLARAVHADRVTIGFVDIDPGVQVPLHQHENEQVGFVLRGSVTMVIGGQSRELRVGETYQIASQVPHSAKAGPDGVSVVDVFAPVREDWKGVSMLEPFPGRWPERSPSA
jgi:quercetin dioxygenase-like cupin family protein